MCLNFQYSIFNVQWKIRTFAPAFKTTKHWRDGRVVDYSSLENYRTERYRGFESLSLRKVIRTTLGCPYCMIRGREKDGTALEQKLLQGHGSELHAVLRLLCPDTAVATLPGRTLRGTEGYHRTGALGLFHHCPAVPTLQRLYGRLLPAQDGPDGVLRHFCHLLRRLPGGIHALAVHDCTNASWGTLRGTDGLQFHRGHRCAALQSTH